MDRVWATLAALLPAFVLARLLVRHTPGSWRAAIFALAGVAGLWLAFWLMLLAVTPLGSTAGVSTAGTTAGVRSDNWTRPQQ